MPARRLRQAQRFRSWFRARVPTVREVDVLLAPATPVRAPRIGQERILMDGVEVLVRPIWASTPSRCPSSGCRCWRSRSSAPAAVPLGVQLIGAPFREAACSGSGRSWKPRAWWRRR